MGDIRRCKCLGGGLSKCTGGHSVAYRSFEADIRHTHDHDQSRWTTHEAPADRRPSVVKDTITRGVNPHLHSLIRGTSTLSFGAVDIFCQQSFVRTRVRSVISKNIFREREACQRGSSKRGFGNYWSREASGNIVSSSDAVTVLTRKFYRRNDCIPMRSFQRSLR